jgi:isoleucyl-tRNA synthetase
VDLQWHPKGAYLAALVTDLTPELVQEGLAREFVRRVQDLRKTAGLEISDRIRLYYKVSDLLYLAVKNFGEYIKAETLALELVPGPVPDELPRISDSFDGEQMIVGVKKAS